MRLVKGGIPPCGCKDKIEAFRQAAPDGDEWAPGTVVECDCGKQFRLRRREGKPHWVWQLRDMEGRSG